MVVGVSRYLAIISLDWPFGKILPVVGRVVKKEQMEPLSP